MRTAIALIIAAIIVPGVAEAMDTVVRLNSVGKVTVSIRQTSEDDDPPPGSAVTIKATAEEENAFASCYGIVVFINDQYVGAATGRSDDAMSIMAFLEIEQVPEELSSLRLEMCGESVTLKIPATRSEIFLERKPEIREDYDRFTGTRTIAFSGGRLSNGMKLTVSHVTGGELRGKLLGAFLTSSLGELEECSDIAMSVDGKPMPMKRLNGGSGVIGLISKDGAKRLAAARRVEVRGCEEESELLAEDVTLLRKFAKRAVARMK